MIPWAAHRAGALLAALSLAGCSPDLRDAVVKHRAAVEATLASARLVRDAARSAPAAASGVVQLGSPAPVLARPTSFAVVNTALEYLEDLEDPTELGNVPHRIVQTGLLNRCAAAMKTHREPFDPATPNTVPSEVTGFAGAHLLEQCAALRYLIVIRTVAYAAPSELRESIACGAPSDEAVDAGQPAGVDAGALSPPATCLRFDGGYLRAEGLVFDLASRAPLGGFPFEAESDLRIDVGRDPGNKSRVIETNLTTEIASSFRKAASLAMPSLTVQD